MQWARDNIYLSWENHYAAADYFTELGQHEVATEHIYEAARFLIERVGVEPAATYDNIIALIGVMIQEPYSAYDRAEGLYHQAIALAPGPLGGLLRVGCRPPGQGRCSRGIGHPPAVQRAIRRAAGVGRGRAHPPPVCRSMTEAVTVVIPHYRADVLYDCVASIYAHSDYPVCVLVVDDGGNAPSLQRAKAAFPELAILRNERNLGFAAACNRGLAAAHTRYAVCCSTTTPTSSRTGSAPSSPWPIATPRSPPVSPSCARPARPSTSTTEAGPVAISTLWGTPFVGGGSSIAASATRGNTMRPYPALLGLRRSPLFLRVAAVRQVGFFDPEYFMHFEEIDLCWRLQLAGYQIRAVPQSVVFHHSGFSQPPATFRKTYFNHRNSLITLCKNEKAKPPAVAAAFAPVVGGVGRALLHPPRSMVQRPSPLCRFALVPRASAQHLSPPPPEPSYPRRSSRTRRGLSRAAFSTSILLAASSAPPRSCPSQVQPAESRRPRVRTPARGR